MELEKGDLKKAGRLEGAKKVQMKADIEGLRIGQWKG